MRKAVDRWWPLVAKWRKAAELHQPAPPAEVAEMIAKISDSTELLALERALLQEVAAKREKDAYHAMMLAMVQTLARNPHPAAAESLARHAVFANFQDVRTAAINGLKKHPLEHFAPLLLSGLQMPIQAEAQYKLGFLGELISRYSVFQEGALANRSFTKTNYPGPVDAYNPGPVDAYGFTGWAMAWQASVANSPVGQKSQEQAASDRAAFEKAVQRANDAIAQRNSSIEAVLCQTTGLDCGDDPMKWWTWWWRDYNETSYGGGTDQTTVYPPKPEYHSESGFVKRTVLLFRPGDAGLDAHRPASDREDQGRRPRAGPGRGLRRVGL